VYADNINISGENAYTIEKNIEALSEASREVDPEVISEKTKYMVMSRH